MKVVTVRQTATRSVFIIYNDNEKAVGKLDMNRLVTADEAMGMAFRFEKKNPKLFPGAEEKQKRFDAMIERMNKYG